MDGVLALTILLWVGGLAFTGLLPAKVDAFLPVVIGAMVIHRLLVVLEHQRREPERGESSRLDLATDVVTHVARRPAAGSHAA